ncbi:hypothetical protein CHLRE_02g141351v5 [Chlamydomonas reinhardtii]|uniref:Uncharacterized protein n=1 Tax=Chlamydomonas reinhardtii TaxID=3055 RepID=A0A2K3E454_CHLRE|nr:uncharacterized protein CHLRE_02g141351v5 [Chlamydomonas reinhardtii]PNW87559.1 hypothetical protein CHLRE_02g141351v5 [Chlamydomonas reinhardtii]
MVGIDTGRAKPVVAAISKRGIQRPSDHLDVPSRAFYRDMGMALSRTWSEGRASQPAVRAALNALSAAGGLHNGVASKWRDTLQAERQHEATLRQEYLLHAARLPAAADVAVPPQAWSPRPRGGHCHGTTAGGGGSGGGG